MRKFKHKNGKDVAFSIENGYRTELGEFINARFIENSCDWVEIKPIPPINTRIKIIETVDGCRAAENKEGVVTDEKPTDGISSLNFLGDLEAFNVKIGKRVWRIACKKYEIIEDIPVGTKVVDTLDNTIWIKKYDNIWEYSDIFISKCIFESEIGEGKRFQIVKEEPKRDWEILSYRANKKIGMIPEYTILEKEKDGIFRNHKACILTISTFEDKLLNNSNYNIHSVKRLSDGEIFTLGDRVDFTLSTNQIIKEFSLIGNHISVISELSKDGLLVIKKSKQVLFITEDGKEICSGDSYYTVYYKKYLGREPFLKVNGEFTANFPLDKEAPSCLKFFSSYEAAENFILLNKPCLSIHDILEYGGINNIQRDKLKNLVKSKL